MCIVILENPGHLLLRIEGMQDRSGQVAVSATEIHLSICQKNVYPDYTSRYLKLGTIDILKQIILLGGGGAALVSWGHFALVFLPPCYLAHSVIAGAQPFGTAMILKTDVMM